MKIPRHACSWVVVTAVVVALGVGTWRDVNFWSTADQRGERLMQARRFADAAKIFHDPRRKGIAQYRDGQFEAAARTFSHVAGAEGAYNAGNAWLMHGKYEDAIRSYDTALGLRPGWKEADENRSLAITRRDRLDASGRHRDEESADAYKPDEIVYDPKGSDQGKRKPDAAEGGEGDEAALQATWLRRVKTTPADFLKAKFAWQAQTAPLPDKR